MVVPLKTFFLTTSMIAFALSTSQYVAYPWTQSQVNWRLAAISFSIAQCGWLAINAYLACLIGRLLHKTPSLIGPLLGLSLMLSLCAQVLLANIVIHDLLQFSADLEATVIR